MNDTFVQIMKLAQKLGWTDIGLFGRLFDDEIIYYFSEGKMDSLYFQINVSPRLCCMIYDIPHNIFINWHEIEIKTLFSSIEKESTRLSPVFSKNIFTTAHGRKQLRMTHPEFFGYTWADGGGVIDREGKHVWTDCTCPKSL